MADKLRSRLRCSIAIEVGSIFCPPKLGLFDLVLCSLADPYLTLEALVNISRLLTAGGDLLLTTPSRVWAEAVRKQLAFTEFYQGGRNNCQGALVLVFELCLAGTLRGGGISNCRFSGRPRCRCKDNATLESSDGCGRNSGDRSRKLESCSLCMLENLVSSVSTLQLIDKMRNELHQSGNHINIGSSFKVACKCVGPSELLRRAARWREEPRAANQDGNAS